jgi:ABC-type transporter Mla MlaB component
MLRISEVQPPNHSVTLRLEGRVAGPWVAEARKACEDVLAGGRVLKLDLAEVEFLDAEGVALLADFRSRGVAFVAYSPFVEAQLKASPGPGR